MSKSMIKFDLPKDKTSIIRVIGVGGGGSNAVNHMFRQGIKGVDFIICNTDAQALDISPVPVKLQLGANLTEGRGAGSIPEMGKNAALENIEDILTYLDSGCKMVFITAGLGGGTGTGAAPIIAAAAKERGILTVGIVTVPFTFEGKKRRQQAEEGLNALRSNVDTLLVICNDRLREMYGNLTLANAFAQADNVLTTAARGIAEIITVTGYINVDFEDVRTVMTDSGAAIMGSATAEGDNRALKAAENALSSPLLNDNNIRGAKYILLNITSGNTEVLMDEISEITDYIQEEAGSTADIIWGTGHDETLGEKISVTLIATGFKANPDTGLGTDRPMEKVIRRLVEEPVKPAPEAKSPVQSIEPVLRSRPGAAREPELPKERQNAANGLPQEPKKEADARPQEQSPTEPFLKQAGPGKEEKQVSIEFDLRPRKASSAEPASGTASGAGTKDNDLVLGKQPAPLGELPIENQERKAKERISRLRELSYKLRTPSGITDLESEPAYKRRNVALENTPHSSESEVSRYTLSENENGDKEKAPEAKLRPNNPFLHDNVD